MKSAIITLAAVSALAIAAPAASQTANANISARVDNLQTQIQAGVQRGTITRTEARTLREQLRLLRQTERQYSANGLTRTERQDLQSRIQNLRAQIRLAARNDSTRYGASGFIDRDDDGWDDRDTDHDGRIDGAYGQGGPYEEVCENRGGIGGVLGNIFGNKDDDCGLRVGQRVTDGLYGVPYEYRNTYRDGNGVYYRSDGQNIYQVDARTHVVTRIYDID